MPTNIPITLPIRNIERDSGRPVVSHQLAPRIDFIPPPHQPVVLQKVHKRGSSNYSQ